MLDLSTRAEAVTWAVTGQDAGAVSGAGGSAVGGYVRVERLVGSQGEDAFTFAAAPVGVPLVSGGIDGQGGADSLDFTGYAGDSRWALDGGGAGTDITYANNQGGSKAAYDLFTPLPTGNFEEVLDID